MARKRKNTSTEEARPPPSIQFHVSSSTQPTIQQTQSTLAISHASGNEDPSPILSSFNMPDASETRCTSEMELFAPSSSQVSASGSALTPPTIPPAQLSQIPSTKKVRGKPVIWTPEMTQIMVREVVQQIHAGKCSDNGFKSEVWREICQVVVKMGGRPADILTGEKCQSKLENVLFLYTLLISLLTNRIVL